MARQKKADGSGRWSGYGPTHEAARLKLIESKRRAVAVEAVAVKAQTQPDVADFWPRFIAERKRVKGMEESTEDALTAISAHMLEFAGTIALKDIDRDTAVDLYDTLIENERSVKRATEVLRYFKAMTAQAVQMGALAADPLRGYALTRITRDAAAPFTEQQDAAIIAAAVGDPDELPFLLARAHGLRISEVLGIRLQDVPQWEQEAHTKVSLYVHNAIKRNRKEGAPKGNSYRHLHLKPLVAQLLKQHIERERPTRLLFTSPNGEAWVPATFVQQRYLRLLIRAGIACTRKGCAHHHLTPFACPSCDCVLYKPIKFHTFRHTFATRWIANGGQLYRVSRLLGHASTAITEKTYVHWLPSMEDASVFVDEPWPRRGLAVVSDLRPRLEQAHLA